MKRAIVAMALVATAAVTAAQDPERCLAKSTDASALTITHGGKTYRMANDACRAQFLTDPERYSQLYDALLELEAEGTPVRAATPSLVPS